LKDIVILDGARTPMAEYNGSFSDISAIDLAVVAAKEALSRSGVAPEEVNHVIVGNALQTSGDAIYGARHVGLKAGVPKEVPALTLNRLCGSGIQSIISAAEQIQLDEATTVLAGGMENMSQAPHVIRGARKGLKLGQGALEDSLMVALLDSYVGLYMAQTSDNLARKYSISREEQDQFALQSQKRASDAENAGRLKEEIVAVPVGRKGELITSDDHLRPDTTMEGLAKLSLHLRRTASSPPATPAASSTAPPWSSSPAPTTRRTRNRSAASSRGASPDAIPTSWASDPFLRRRSR
jgi:acetyl-CoA acetyltransferase family protein